MVDVLDIVIGSICFIGISFTILFVATIRRQDARIAQLEAQEAVNRSAFEAQARAHEAAIQRTADGVAWTSREVSHLAVVAARLQAASDAANPLDKTEPGTVYARRTIIP